MKLPRIGSRPESGASSEQPDPDAAPIAEPPAVDPLPGDARPADAPPDKSSAPRKLSRWRDRRAGALIGVLCGLLGFGIVVQIHSTSTSSLIVARQDDLVSILDDLSSQQERIRGEIADLQGTQRRIADSGTGSAAAIADARERARTLGILAGTEPAEGAALKVTVAQGRQRIPAAVILDAIEELRGAGAETMQISGGASAPVRLGASSYVTDTANGIAVDGTRLMGPYAITAIGDPATMSAAMQIPGGVVDTVSEARGSATLDRVARAVIRAVRGDRPTRYSQPGS